MKEKKRMIMIGPGYGHNILPIIEELNKQSFFDVDFLCHSLKFKQKDYDNINFIPFPIARRIDVWSCMKYILFHLKYSIFGKRYDILLIQGETGLFLTLLLIFIKAKNKIFVPWSYGVLNISQKKSKEGLLARLIFKKSDYISTNWYSEKESIKRLFPKSKIILFYWGLEDVFFNPADTQIESQFVKNFLNNIPEHKNIVFWPRSIIRYHRQDMVVEALAFLKNENSRILDDFVLFLWTGNVEDKQFRSEIENLIKKFNLTENVKIIDHPFVNYNDIRIIENRSNFFINISISDGLSTFILEMLLQGRDIILSNNPTYKYLNDFFDLRLDLVDIDVAAIAAAIKTKLNSKNNSDSDIKEKRKKVVFENFRFTKNYPLFIEFMYSLS